MNSDIVSHIHTQLQRGGIFQPVLFLGNNLELLHQDIDSMVEQLFAGFQVDPHFLFVFDDDGKSIKTKEIQEFFQNSFIRPSGKFQVFLVRNFSRSTLQAFNASLKILEEPGEGNVIFLTAPSLSGLPETIISRLKIVETSPQKTFVPREEYLYLIDGYFKHKPHLLVEHFYESKVLKKQDYIDFLDTFLYYITKHPRFAGLASYIADAKQNITLHHAIGRLEIDRLLILLQNYEK